MLKQLNTLRHALGLSAINCLHFSCMGKFYHAVLLVWCETHFISHLNQPVKIIEFIKKQLLKAYSPSLDEKAIDCQCVLPCCPPPWGCRAPSRCCAGSRGRWTEESPRLKLEEWGFLASRPPPWSPDPSETLQREEQRLGDISRPTRSLCAQKYADFFSQSLSLFIYLIKWSMLTWHWLYGGCK